MAFSWSGFARTLNDNITKDRDAEREQTLWERRKKMEMELEKQYAAEVVARTVLEGNKEVMYNSRGDRIRERVLSPEEVAEREAALRKIKAEAENAEVTTGYNRFRLETAPEDRELDRTLTMEQITSQRHGRAMDSGRLALERERVALDRAASGGLPKELAKEADEVLMMINATPPDGVNSPQAMEQAFLASLDAAGDVNEARRIIARVKGQILNRYTQGQTQARSTNSGMFGGLDAQGALPPPAPGTR